MRSSICLLTTVAVLAACGSSALADRWCASANGGSWVFCDDFDRYCDAPPPEPDTCATDATLSDTALRAVWLPQGTCGNLLKINEGNNFIESLPYSARYPQSDTLDLAYHKAALPQPMDGTDANPLVLRYALDTQTTGTWNYNTAIMELSFGSDHVPADYVLSPNCFEFCTTNPGPNRQYNILCQQDFPPANCPPPFTTPRAAIAVGLLAYLDNDPCHCATSSQRPSNSHLNFFDGLKWHILKSNTFPGNGGDFSVQRRFNFITVTVRTNDIFVEMLSTNPDPDLYSTATIPRQYLGPFDSVNYGIPAGCLLSGTTYECVTPGSETCLQASANSGAHEIDGVVLYGGVQVAVEGACCANDASCTVTTLPDCQSQGGHFQGYNTTCETVTCCAYPFADGDHDGDVDQDDFGLFQVCFTNLDGGVPPGCECYNRDGDGDVDGADFQAFNNCWTGANIAWSPGLTPQCAP